LLFVVLITSLISLGQGEHDKRNTNESERGLVYLVYAGPYASSPASTFGHLYLAIADSIDHPPALWNVVTFNAETYGAGSVKYLATGISGGFLGRFEKTNYLSKVQDYVINEDRDLWILKLSLSISDVASLRDTISRVSDTWYPYSFFKRNCAFYVQSILHEALSKIPAPKNIVSPSSVVREVMASGIVESTYFKSRMSESLREQARTLEDDFTKAFKKGRSNALSKVLATDSLTYEQYRYSLLYFWWSQKDIKSHLPDDEEEALEKLRMRGVSSEYYSEPQSDWIGERSEPGFFHPYSRFESRAGGELGEGTFLSLSIRAGAYDHKDAGPTRSALNQLELFSADVLLDVSSGSIHVEQLTLVSQLALIPRNWLQRKRSWSLEIAGQMGGIQGKQDFHSYVKYGSGITIQLQPNLYFYSLASAGVNHAYQEKVVASAGVLSGVVWRPMTQVRIGGSYSFDRSVANSGNYFQYGELWMSVNSGRSYIFTAQVRSSSSNARIWFGVSRYL
jgi:hypothetical protein